MLNCSSAPQTLVECAKRMKNPLCELLSLVKLLVILLNTLHMLSSGESDFEQFAPVGFMIFGSLHKLIGRVTLPSFMRALLGFIAKPFTTLYEKIK